MAELREKDTLLRGGIAGTVVAATGYAPWRRRKAARGEQVSATGWTTESGSDDGDG